jgi:hypothetical protein
MEAGRLRDDPRSTGLGLALLSLIAMVSDSYAEALEYSEQSLAVAITPLDRHMATQGKGTALVLLRHADAGVRWLEEYQRQCISNGELYGVCTSDGPIAVGKVIQGNIRDGISLLETAISKQDVDGYQGAANWYRGFLAEVYLQIIAGNEKLPLPILVKNLPILLKVMATAPSRIRALMTHVLKFENYDPNGYYIGRAHMLLGLLYKIKKKRALALQHLTEARRIFSELGETPILARVDAALPELA